MTMFTVTRFVADVRMRVQRLLEEPIPLRVRHALLYNQVHRVRLFDFPFIRTLPTGSAKGTECPTPGEFRPYGCSA